MRIAWVTIGATAAGVLTAATSLVSSPDYRGPVGIALVLAALSLTESVVVLIKSRSRARWTILIVAVPVAVFTLDNIGRMLMILHLGGFRILI